MSCYMCGGCNELRDCDFVGCTEGPDGELYCDQCVTDLTDKFNDEGDPILQPPRPVLAHLQENDMAEVTDITPRLQAAQCRRYLRIATNIEAAERERQVRIESRIAYIEELIEAYDARRKI